MTEQLRSKMMFGALVSDAAAMGTHWIYDPDRLAQIAKSQGGTIAFTPTELANYEGVASFFAHGARKEGALSQYGESMWLAMRVILASGGQFDVAAQSAGFAAHFGPGGAYHGYIDRPTKGALTRIVDEQTPSGIDDDQLPALSRLVAVLGASLPDASRDAMQITNVNSVADQYHAVMQVLLERLIGGAQMTAALCAAADGAHPDIRAPLLDALSTSENCATTYAQKTGRACHLPMAGPLMFHILARASSYRDAVERNILAGGDTCGRSLILGAAMALVDDVPLEWAVKLKDSDAILTCCAAVAQA